MPEPQTAESPDADMPQPKPKPKPAPKAEPVAKAEPAAKAQTKPKPNLRVLETLRARAAPDVADETKPARKTAKRRAPGRHRVLAASFAAVVLAPTLLAGGYMAFIAADQYDSHASFAVRSIESTAGASDILGMFSQTAASSTVSDSYILLDYIRSDRMLDDTTGAFDLDRLYARRGLDVFYALAPGLAREERLDFWRSVVSVDFDLASGIIDLQIKAFDPADAQRLAEFVIRRSEALVNQLSQAAREEVLRNTQMELALAERRLTEARLALHEYRSQSQEIDPREEAQRTATLIGSLEERLAQARGELSALEIQTTQESPRTRAINARIASIEKQIEAARQRVGAGGTGSEERASDVAGRILGFERLETEREFAERTYTAALASLEKARVDAGSKQRYFALFVPPAQSELAQYPARLLNTALVFLGGLFVWGVGAMAYYSIRDRA